MKQLFNNKKYVNKRNCAPSKTAAEIPWAAIDVFVLFGAFRIWLGQMIGMWFPAEQTYDDALMINYADIGAYFMTPDLRNVMLKELGMPLMYQIINYSGLSFSAAVSLLWILNGITGSVIMQQLTKNRKLSVLIGVFMMFQPSAFDSWCGTRLYRAALLNPLYLLSLLLAIKILVYIKDSFKKTRNLILLLITEGVVFTITFYIKEDGMWLLAVLIFIAVFWILSAFKNISNSKKRIRLVLFCMIPFFIFTISTICYKGINYHYFGVFETNIRTSGETMRFVSNLYRIDSEDKTDVVWASKGAIEEAFNASETLKNKPEFKEYLFHNNWNNKDIAQTPYNGDFITWAIKDGIFDTGIASNPAEKEAFFKKVNTELAQAFKQGTLAENKGRMMIYPSMGAFSQEGLLSAFKKAFKLYGRHILMRGYHEGGTLILKENTSASPLLYEKASSITNMNLNPVETETGIQLRQEKLEIGNHVAGSVFVVYRIWFPLMLLQAIAGVIAGFMVSLKKHDDTAKSYFMYIILSIGFLGISFVYNYMIALWCFCFNRVFVEAENMYSVGLVSVLCAFILLGTALLYNVSVQRKVSE